MVILVCRINIALNDFGFTRTHNYRGHMCCFELLVVLSCVTNIYSLLLDLWNSPKFCSRFVVNNINYTTWLLPRGHVYILSI